MVVTNVTLRELTAADTDQAARLLASAMAANPTHVAVFGHGAIARAVPLMRAVVSMVHARQGVLFGAWHGTHLAGVAGMMPPGTCRRSLSQRLRLARSLRPLPGPLTTMRLLRWQQGWQRRHPRAPHWHLGPYAVDASYRGGAVALRLARACARRLDAASGPAYLETDRERNVRLYRHFGFRVLHRGAVLGVPQWFMWRDASLPRRPDAPA